MRSTEHGFSLAKVHEVLEAHTDSFKRAVQAGVKIAMGTDAVDSPPGHSLEELELMRQTDYLRRKRCGRPPHWIGSCCGSAIDTDVSSPVCKQTSSWYQATRMPSKTLVIASRLSTWTACSSRILRRVDGGPVVDRCTLLTPRRVANSFLRETKRPDRTLDWLKTAKRVHTLPKRFR